MGQDGYNGSYNPLQPNIHKYVGRDAAGFILGYHSNDYNPINTGVPNFVGDVNTAATSSSSVALGNELYNGNIRHMATAIRGTNLEPIAVSLGVYQYDQLNRLKEANYYLGSSNPNNYSNLTASNAYDVSLTYDANGNIENLIRNGSPGDVSMDDFTYHYKEGRNQLTHVDDAVTNNAYDLDLKDQEDDNYVYDEIGQLIKDEAEEIDEIRWDSRGKVTHIIRTQNSDKSDLEFLYDALGQRVVKIECIDCSQSGLGGNQVNLPNGIGLGNGNGPGSGNGSGGSNAQPNIIKKFTFYVRDAQGNVVATYSATQDKVNQIKSIYELYHNDHHIYGSSRLGVRNSGLHLRTVDKGLQGTTITYEYQPDDPRLTERELGDKHYELSNHLGNVLAVVSDRKVPTTVTSNTGPIDHYDADVVQYTDYYPFGMQMPERFSADSDYRYSFQGQEADDEIKGEGNSINYKYRMHDPRLGRFFAVDPLVADYPHNSPYAFSENVVIHAVELEGAEKKVVITFNIHSWDDETYVKKVNSVDVELTWKEFAELMGIKSSQNDYGPLGRGVLNVNINKNDDWKAGKTTESYSYEPSWTDENRKAQKWTEDDTPFGESSEEHELDEDEYFVDDEAFKGHESGGTRTKTKVRDAGWLGSIHERVRLPNNEGWSDTTFKQGSSKYRLDSMIKDPMSPDTIRIHIGDGDTATGEFELKKWESGNLREYKHEK